MVVERFSAECHETKTEVITLANRNKRKQHNEPIRGEFSKLPKSFPVREVFLCLLYTLPVKTKNGFALEIIKNWIFGDQFCVCKMVFRVRYLFGSLKNAHQNSRQVHVTGIKRRKMRAGKLRLVLICFSLVKKVARSSFSNQSQSVVKQDQRKSEITFDTQLQTALKWFDVISTYPQVTHYTIHRNRNRDRDHHCNTDKHCYQCYGKFKWEQKYFKEYHCTHCQKSYQCNRFEDKTFAWTKWPHWTHCVVIALIEELFRNFNEKLTPPFTTPTNSRSILTQNFKICRDKWTKS